MENGKTQTFSSDILVGLSNVFYASVDYLLGRTIISDMRTYDISELGLSEIVVKQLVGKRINYKVLNLLLKHREFPKLVELINLYFDSTVSIGVLTRNELFDSAISRLVDLSVEKPEYKEEMRKDINVIATQKLGEHEVKLERSRRIVMSILEDVEGLLYCASSAKSNYNERGVY